MSIKTILIPNIGDVDEVEVVEVLVSAGDSIAVEDSLITVETDKASMEIPSSDAGIIQSVEVSIGDMVKEGTAVIMLELAEAAVTDSSDAEKPEAPAAAEASSNASSDNTTSSSAASSANEATKTEKQGKQPPAPTETASSAPNKTEAENKASPTASINESGFKLAYASPSIRRVARELGVDLIQVVGTGRKQRILKEDVYNHVKAVMTAPAAKDSGTMLGITPMPEIDFSQWGEIKTEPLTKINKLTGEYLHRSWVTAPHVTQFDEADITEMETFRKQLGKEMEKEGVKITPLAFIIKAVVATLKQFPRANSSLDVTGENLIIKDYYHIGIAVNTPDGLVVPVIRDADKKTLIELSNEVRDYASRARKKKLKPTEMQGGTFSISSLGGVGGTSFTPIVNAPEVAILGVSNSKVSPVWDGNEFQPRTMLPVSLSYDHRVVDGVLGAQFTTYLCRMLTDIRRLLV